MPHAMTDSTQKMKRTLALIGCFSVSLNKRLKDCWAQELSLTLDLYVSP